ncbi:MAG: hypothetical protein NVV59_18005 [Chitinophagaceae bacterium]|nr:hypothetical protein [Chitinophagaceae bacterium]
MKLSHRKNIYYWKTDRPYGEGNVQRPNNADVQDLTVLLRNYLVNYFRIDLIDLRPGNGQGNHVTFLADYPDTTYFIRIENGPEMDDYMDVESAVLKKVNAIGVPSPRVFHSDKSRLHVPFAIQIIEYIDCVDLNVLDKDGKLDILPIAEKIGAYVAKWQSITFKKFGLFDAAAFATDNALVGFHDNYRDYFFLKLGQASSISEADFFPGKETGGRNKSTGRKPSSPAGYFARLSGTQRPRTMEHPG